MFHILLRQLPRRPISNAASNAVKFELSKETWNIDPENVLKFCPVALDTNFRTIVRAAVPIVKTDQI